tara:strand:+ start:64 stop:771 length:708 start_codon:yes stop_codon:yes gene_type:complete
MNVSNDSYSCDVPSVEKGNKILESNRRIFQNLWVQRECYLHTLWQAEELPSLYENNEVIVPENITFLDSLKNKYITRFSKSRKIDRKRITGHLQGKSEAIKFVSINGKKPKTAAIENKLYKNELKKFDIGRAVLMNEAIKRCSPGLADKFSDRFGKLPLRSEIALNQNGTKFVSAHSFKNHSVVGCNESLRIAQIFDTALWDSTFGITYEEYPVPHQLFRTKLSIYLVKRERAFF